MDDIEGWPEVTGRRIGHEGEKSWTISLTPESLRMIGPNQDATVAVENIYAVRQRPAADQVPDGSPATVVELEWVTALGEVRILALRCEDPANAGRLVQVLEQNLRRLDGEDLHNRRRVDWFLIVLFTLGAGIGVRGLSEAVPLISPYDWTAALTQFVADVFALPVLYLLLRALLRWARGRKIR